MKYLWAILSTLILECICDTTKMLVCTHRHGVRNPGVRLPYMPIWFDPSMQSELTQVGMRQEYLLGVYMRLKYSSFIPESFNPNQIYIRSTNTNRTIQSAYCHSYGLFTYSYKMTDHQIIASRPPVVSNLSFIENQLESNVTYNNFIPSIIHTILMAYDTLLASDWGLCKYFVTLQKMVYQTSEWKNLNNKFKIEYLPIISEIFDFNQSLVDEKDYIDLLDYIICGYYNGYIDLDLEILERFQNMYSDLFSMEIVGPQSMNYTMAKLSATNLLNDIVEKFDRKIHDSSYEMLYVEYSFHDSSIMHILHSLDLVKGSPYIKFASNVIFELRTDNSVRVAYNGDELLNLPFENFKKKVESSIYTQKEWKKLCE